MSVTLDEALRNAPADRIRRDFHEHDAETCVITEVQDVEPILEANKKQQNDGTNGYSPTREWKHVARIPSVMYLKILNEHGIDLLNPNHREGVRRLLNSSEYAHLRTSLGII